MLILTTFLKLHASIFLKSFSSTTISSPRINFLNQTLLLFSEGNVLLHKVQQDHSPAILLSHSLSSTLKGSNLCQKLSCQLNLVFSWLFSPPPDRSQYSLLTKNNKYMHKPLNLFFHFFSPTSNEKPTPPSLLLWPHHFFNLVSDSATGWKLTNSFLCTSSSKSSNLSKTLTLVSTYLCTHPVHLPPLSISLPAPR